jgi:hypothetical protein
VDQPDAIGTKSSHGFGNCRNFVQPLELQESLRASFGLLRWRKVIQQSEKFTPHLFSFLRAAVLERLERFVETKSARPSKWLKDNGHWVELASSSKTREQCH